MPKFPIHVDPQSPFPKENIPFGIFSPRTGGPRRAGTAIGDYALDLASLEQHGLFTDIFKNTGEVFSNGSLNTFAGLPRDVRRKTREAIISLVSSEGSPLYQKEDLNKSACYPLADIQLHLPMDIPEYTDFSCFEEHVSNCVRLTGGPSNFVPPNFYKSPIAYSGRVSSIILSGTDYIRPHGVYQDPSTSEAVFAPTQKLDYELEMGIFVSSPVPWGQTVSADMAAVEHIFGFVLLNDWSARDNQFYESSPIGPFNSKAAGTSISPWVIMPEALEAARTAPLHQKPGDVPAHLEHADLAGTIYDISFESHLARAGTSATRVSRSNLKHSYFSLGQMLAHRACSGCGLRTGELVATGTVSSPAAEQEDKTVGRNGCLLELSEMGARDVIHSGGTWLEDGDTVTFTGWAKGANGVKIGFGELAGKVAPARR